MCRVCKGKTGGCQGRLTYSRVSCLGTGVFGHSSETTALGITIQSLEEILRVGDHWLAMGHDVQAEAVPALAL